MKDCYWNRLQIVFFCLMKPSQQSWNKMRKDMSFMEIYTAWKVSKYGVFSGPYFPPFGLNTVRYSVSLRFQSKCGKIWTRKKFRIWILFTQYNFGFWGKSWLNFTQNRSSHQRCSIKEGVVRNFAEFTEKHLWQSFYFNKVAGLRLHLTCFPVNFAKFLIAPFLQNMSGRLLLTKCVLYWKMIFTTYSLICYF